MLLFSPRKAVLFCQWNYRKAPKLLLFIYNMFLPAAHMRWGCVFFTCPSLHAVTRWILQPVTKWHRFDLLFLLQAFFWTRSYFNQLLTSFLLKTYVQATITTVGSSDRGALGENLSLVSPSGSVLLLPLLSTFGLPGETQRSCDAAGKGKFVGQRLLQRQFWYRSAFPQHAYQTVFEVAQC